MNNPSNTSELVHSSTRTALSINVDPDTQGSTQVLVTSRVVIDWVEGAIRVRGMATRVETAGGRSRQDRRGFGR